MSTCRFKQHAVQHVASNGLKQQVVFQADPLFTALSWTRVFVANVLAFISYIAVPLSFFDVMSSFHNCGSFSKVFFCGFTTCKNSVVETDVKSSFDEVLLRKQVNHVTLLPKIVSMFARELHFIPQANFVSIWLGKINALEYFPGTFHFHSN